MDSTKTQDKAVIHKAKMDDHDENCPCLSISRSLAAAQLELTSAPPLKPALVQNSGSEHASNLFDRQQLNYLQKIELDPDAVFVPLAPTNVQEGAKIRELNDEIFGNFKDVAQQAISARKSDKVRRKVTKKTTRKRVPDFLVSQMRVKQVPRTRFVAEPDAATEAEQDLDPSARQFVSGSYEQFHYPSYKRFQSGQFDRSAHDPSLSSADDSQFSDQSQLSDEDGPAPRTSCSFLSKAAQRVSDAAGCDHTDLIKIMAIAAESSLW